MEGSYRAFQEEFSSLHDVLNADVLAAAATLEREDTQYNRRVLVRAMFAALEGLLFWIRQENLRSANSHPELYSPAELALLNEESYELGNGGDVVIRTRFLPFRPLLRFTLVMTAKRGQSGFKLDVSDHGWQALGEAVEVRHRITHPKSRQALDIAESELKALRAGYTPAHRAVVLTLLSTYDSVMSEVRRLRQELDNPASGADESGVVEST